MSNTFKTIAKFQYSTEAQIIKGPNLLIFTGDKVLLGQNNFLTSIAKRISKDQKSNWTKQLKSDSLGLNIK